MPHYTGAANSFSDLRSALLSACTDNGWSLDSGILSKGAAFVRPYVSSTMTSTEGPGLIIEGGVGASGGSLTGASECRPRLGRPGAAAPFTDVVWPATYHIFVHTDPDEVYVVLNYNVSYHYWLAFGVSDVSGLPGTGLWLAGIYRRQYATSTTTGDGYRLSPTAGDSSGSVSRAFVPGGIFWNSSKIVGLQYSAETIHTGLDGDTWAGGPSDQSVGAINAIQAAIPLIGRTPSAWNSDAPLIPIQVHQWRASNKCSLVADLRHARYIRVNNYEPGDLITLGGDVWKVFPFHLKNSDVPDGGTGLAHTGTFGWAIRYDGP